MTVHPQTTKAKSIFVRKEREEREEKQSVFLSLRPWRPSRTNVSAFAVLTSSTSKNSPQMNANERQSFAFHLRSLRFSRTDAFAFGISAGVLA